MMDDMLKSLLKRVLEESLPDITTEDFEYKDDSTATEDDSSYIEDEGLEEIEVIDTNKLYNAYDALTGCASPIVLLSTWRENHVFYYYFDNSFQTDYMKLEDMQKLEPAAEKEINNILMTNYIMFEAEPSLEVWIKPEAFKDITIEPTGKTYLGYNELDNLVYKGHKFEFYLLHKDAERIYRSTRV